MDSAKVFAMKFSKVYPLLVQKAQRKGRGQAEVDEIIRWLTGYRQEELEACLEKDVAYGAPRPGIPAPGLSGAWSAACGWRMWKTR